MPNVILKDERGFPYIVDDAQLMLGVARDNRPRPIGVGLRRQATSGNKYFDPRTGKFGFAPETTSVKAGGGILRALTTKGRKKIAQRAASIKANAVAAFATEDGVKIILLRNGRPVDEILLPDEVVRSDNKPNIQGEPEELRRRLDAVRDAAREFEDFEEGDVNDFLQGRTLRELTPGEIEAFVGEVREQVLDDLSDILDQRLRKKGLNKLRRNRRIVAVNAPQGYTRKTLHSLMDEEIQRLADRLRARGWTDNDLVYELVNRFDPRRRPQLLGLLGVDAN